ncbi:MAG: RidA family protein [Promethearchaeota archaeon]
MVNIEIVDSGTPVAGPYNLGIKAGNLLFISGQVAAPETRDIKEQTFAAFEKIKKVLETVSASISNIVKVTVYLKKISDFKEMNEAYREFFEKNGVSKNFPARSTVEATCPLPNGLIEIDAIAVL